jgi:threonine dehydrogenase-like Zn-dependent dehydrogenase
VKALRFSKFGPPYVLTIEEIPRPEPRAGEALVQVKAAAINPSDVKNVAGHFPATTLPRTPGRDFSGIVVAGTTYQGQEVWSSGPGLGTTRDGAQSEYVTVPEEVLALKPRTLTLEQARQNQSRCSPSASIDELQLSYRKKALSGHRIKVFVFRYHPKERGQSKAEVAPANLPNA